MTMYAVLVEKYVDEDYESEVLDNKCYANEIDAYKRMMDEAQLTVDDWNENHTGEFKLEVYAKVSSCSVCGEFESDYCSFYVIPMEVK